MSGVTWTFFGQFGRQIISFIVSIVLARLLEPEQFGIVAMAAVFFNLVRWIVDAGLRDSLIQKKDSNNMDYNVVFFYNVITCAALYTVLFLLAPLIAEFYNEQQITAVVRVLSLTLVFGSLSIVQEVQILKRFDFRVLFSVSFPSVIFGGLIGVIMAYSGFGVWSLVGQYLIEVSTATALYWWKGKWVPKIQFSMDVLKYHLSHGWRLLGAQLIGTVNKNLLALVIGRVYSPAHVGFYNRADSLRTLTITNTVGVIERVSYPILSEFQSDGILLKNAYRKLIQSSMLIVLPIFLILASHAESIIIIMLTKKWVPAAHILTVLSFAALLHPFNSLNLNILKVKRRGDLFLRAEIIKMFLFAGIVLITARLGFNYLVSTTLIMAPISMFINNFYANRLIRYSLIEQIGDILPLLLAFFLSFGIIYLTRSFIDTPFLFVNVLLSSVIGVFFYLLAVYLMKKELIVLLIERFLRYKFGYNR